ncbi:MAG: ATP-binding cassette domain-containing protein, partial [Chloroflexi bacterium]|nr:ATP-binding cassette domain-containing protein [Chloroflexota bacterium]
MTQWSRDTSRVYDEPYIVCEDLFKIHKVADLEVVALRGLDLRVYHGEVLAIVGPSGSGKSTLLHTLAGYDTPSAGRVTVAGKNLLKMAASDLVEYRRLGIGFVWQQVSRNLVPYLTAQQNVELPLLLASRKKEERTERAASLLDFVRLGHRAGHTTDRLSGGEQQRVAIAVALANNPPLLLADEPTGELDTKTGQEILDLLRSVNESYGTTIVIVTHDQNISSQVDRVVAMSDGKTSTETVRRRNYEQRGEGDEGIEERAIVDGSGRLQIPKEYLDKLGISERVRVTLEGDRVV